MYPVPPAAAACPPTRDTHTVPLTHTLPGGAFCETTIGYNIEANGKLLQTVFNDPLFHVAIVPDVPGVEVCGALKNVVALGAGFTDGMGLGDNSKAAIIRIGLMEMKKFIQSRYPKVQDTTFFESCGVADLIVTCYGGVRRRLLATGKAHVFARNRKRGSSVSPPPPFPVRMLANRLTPVHVAQGATGAAPRSS